MGNKLDRVIELVEKHGLPGRDLYDLPASSLRFPDGAHYRNELSGVSTVGELEEVASEQARTGLAVHRVIFGDISRMCSSELRVLAQISRDAKIELFVQPGMLNKSDIGRHYQTQHGSHSGFRIRGADNLTYFVFSVMRCIEAGIRGILFFDDGALDLMNRMRQAGDIPAETRFKVSYTVGHTNPSAVRIAQQHGADSVNPITDMEIPMLAALRSVLTIPMDIVVFGWPTLGKINRLYHAPQLVRVAAPCYLKQELYESSSSKVKYCEVIEEIMELMNPELRVSMHGPEDLVLAVPPSK